jgi:hypothetical protein
MGRRMVRPAEKVQGLVEDSPGVPSPGHALNALSMGTKVHDEAFKRRGLA